MIRFNLAAAKPTFRKGVDAPSSRDLCCISAVAFPAHRAGHAEFLELVLKRVAGVLGHDLNDVGHLGPAAGEIRSLSTRPLRCRLSCEV